MNNASRYWHLVRLTSGGQLQTLELATVKPWLQEAFAPWLDNLEEQEAQLQRALFDRWQRGQAEADLAQLSLRGWVTHQIRSCCMGLAQRHGERYGFTTADLLPLVLEDDGRPRPRHQPFTLRILESYDPTKGRLSAWSHRLTKTHPDLNQWLLEKGLYQASDWAILNDTTPAQVQRILRDYHLCSTYEVDQAVALLESYHRVYRQDRLRQRQQGKAGRCPEPSPDQLQAMDSTRSPKQVKANLRQLATQLRQYRIHGRGGHPQLYQPQDDSELESIAQTRQAAPVPDEQMDFLDRYRASLNHHLGGTLRQVIADQMRQLRQRTPPQDSAYVQGLYLRQCEGLAMGAVAPRIGLSSQVQVTRLLNLKRLRAEVRHRLIPQLHATLRQEALNYVSADRLQAIDQTLETLLAETVDDLIAEAAAEAQAPKPRPVKSRFSQHLCTEIHAFLPPQP
ncbi:MAG: hypothetical protein ACHWZW_10270 [Spirulina sp.]